ncbi:putative low-complexity protein [Rivularia sp. PCC 7116]|uniref:pentapeptide repeat-containing protein n=1 Tax=Rivularia sp. PCC 7116 TaxID=373994 RepID=UPI00029F29BE|nr:pentapeptide repeat-containing protein [Rivularia sp. PCC 7116]AFY52934.1 putative low-complexity protein [Rivularia sp. PCC 7116]
MNYSNLNFSNQDLRNRCFKGQNLDYANFSYSDIRGCDFTNTSLREANFQNVKAGQTAKIFICLISIAFATTIVTFHAVSSMIFGVIERQKESPVWVYGVALSISLVIAGIAGVVMSLAKKKSTLQRIAIIISGATSGAILGFFYGGTAAGGKNPQIAIASAAIGALIVAISSFCFQKGFMPIILSAAATIITYAFAFLSGTRAIAFLSTQNLIWGFSITFLSLTYIGFTLISLHYLIKEITSFSVTSFRGCDITNASFKNAKLWFSDFSNAIGKS